MKERGSEVMDRVRLSSASLLGLMALGVGAVVPLQAGQPIAVEQSPTVQLQATGACQGVTCAAWICAGPI